MLRCNPSAPKPRAVDEYIFTDRRCPGAPKFQRATFRSPGMRQVEDERLYQELIAQRPALLDEKVKLHAKIIDEFNLAVLERMPRHELVQELRVYVGEYVRTEKIPLNQRELQAFVEDLVDEMIGFGPIEPLLKDPTITDILINTHKKCFVERFGKLQETTVHFKDEAAPASHHPQDRSGGRAPRRRVISHHRRPPSRWIPRQRRHSTDCCRWSAGFDS